MMYECLKTLIKEDVTTSIATKYKDINRDSTMLWKVLMNTLTNKATKQQVRLWKATLRSLNLANYDNDIKLMNTEIMQLFNLILTLLISHLVLTLGGRTMQDALTTRPSWTNFVVSHDHWYLPNGSTKTNTILAMAESKRLYEELTNNSINHLIFQQH
jgi:ABC-type uncharacterized transport system YnjBCD permease subunit